MAGSYVVLSSLKGVETPVQFTPKKKEIAKHGVVIVRPTSKYTSDGSDRVFRRLIERTKDPETGEFLNYGDFPVVTDPTELRGFEAACIFALGEEAFHNTIGEYGITKLRGYIFDSRYGLAVGSYHSDYIMAGNFKLGRVFQHDLKKCLYVARHGRPLLKKDYILRPSPLEVKEWVEAYLEALRLDPTVSLAFDIETPYAATKDELIDPENEEVNLEDDPSYTINRISFSYAPATAITFPWQEPYCSYAKLALSSGGEKSVWNQHFDVPRLEANGCEINGPLVDGMDAWHYLEPALPMGLKYAATFFCPDMPAWKLVSSSEPEWYSAADADVLWRVLAGTREKLEAQGKWGVFQKHFVALGGVLKRMSQRGIPVDTVKRAEAQKRFEEWYEQSLRDLQPCIPLEAKKKKVYKLSDELLAQRYNLNEGWVKVRVMEEEKHVHVYGCFFAPEPWEQDVHCICGKIKKRPKAFKCTCGKCPVKVKKGRKKKGESSSSV